MASFMVTAGETSWNWMPTSGMFSPVNVSCTVWHRGTSAFSSPQATKVTSEFTSQTKDCLPQLFNFQATMKIKASPTKPN